MVSRSQPVSALHGAVTTSEPSVAKAEFSQSRNDLYWKVYAGEDGFIRWQGYDDRNWWKNVAKTDHTRTRVGKITGRVFTLDHSTGEVTITDPAKSGGA
jgi:hypothetical protein